MTAKRYWWAAAIVFAMVFGAVTYVNLAKDPKHASKTLLMLTGTSPVMGGNNQQNAPDFWGTQLSLLKNNAVQHRAKKLVEVLEPELVPPVSGVIVKPWRERDTTLLNVSATSTNPRYSQVFLDALIQEFLEFRNELRKSTSGETMQAITQELVSLTTQIESQENQLIAFQEKNNLVFMKEQETMTSAQRAALERQLSSWRSYLLLLDSYQPGDPLEELNPVDISAGPGERRSESTDRDYPQLVASYEQLEAEYEENSIYMKPKHPRMYQLSREMERIENLLEIYRKREFAKLASKRIEAQQRIDALNAEISNLEQTALVNRRKLNEYDRVSLTLERAKRNYNQLLAQSESIDLSLTFDSHKFKVLQPASEPKPVDPSVLIQFGIPTLLGLGGAVGVLFALYSMETRIILADDLREHFEQPVIALVPFLKKLPDIADDRETTESQPYLFWEAISGIRSFAVFQSHEHTHASCIMITSAQPQEGKSLMAANLAVSLSSAGFRTLLLDADLRRGRLHEFFKRKSGRGLSHIIAEQADPQGLILRSVQPGLDFISRGKASTKSTELMMSKRFKSVVKSLKEQYEYVVVDCPPVLALEDTRSVIGLMDTTLMVVRANLAPVVRIKESVTLLEQGGGRVDGFILNSIHSNNPTYYGRRVYSEYYKPVEDDDEEVSHG